VRLDALARVEADIIDVLALKTAGLVPIQTDRVKVILAGELKKNVTLKGVQASKGAKAAIEAAGGKVED
jgi:LSU ribosomal protein L15P